MWRVVPKTPYIYFHRSGRGNYVAGTSVHHTTVQCPLHRTHSCSRVQPKPAPSCKLALLSICSIPLASVHCMVEDRRGALLFPKTVCVKPPTCKHQPVQAPTRVRPNSQLDQQRKNQSEYQARKRRESAAKMQLEMESDMRQQVRLVPAGLKGIGLGTVRWVVCTAVP